MTKINQDVTMRQGESKTLEITVVDADDAAVDITSATVNWEMWGRQGRRMVRVTKATGGSGITLSDPTNGIFQVALDPSDTADLPAGEYEHQAKVTDSNSNVAAVTEGVITLMEMRA